MVSFKLSKIRVRLALAAACSGAFLLAACDTSTSTSTAQDASGTAAVASITAGDPHMTDQLIDAVMSGNVSKPGDIKAGHIVQNGADKDLQAGISKLTAAIALPDISANTKSTVQAQLAGMQLQLAEYRLSVLQSDILDLTRMSEILQSLAQTAHDLNAEAATLEKGNKAPTTADSDKARANVSANEKTYADAQARVKDLQDQIAAKESQARKIYIDTDAAFTAADSLKGQAAISAGAKAMTDRKQAEVLMEEAANIASGNVAPKGSPVLNLGIAQAQAALAKIALEDAQKVVVISQAAYDQAKAASAANTQRVAALRAAASKIIGDESSKDSVRTRYAAFMEAAAKIDKEVRDAAAAADQSASNYGAALASYNTFTSELGEQANKAALEPSDPLRKIASDARPAVVLMWSQSAAQQQAGRVFTAGFQAEQIVSEMDRQAASVGLPKITISQSTDNAGDAGKRFTQAATTAKTANSRSAPANSDLDRMKWIGFSLEATANQGASIAFNEVAERASAQEKATALRSAGDARKAAGDARTEALRRNPSLNVQLGWIQ